MSFGHKIKEPKMRHHTANRFENWVDAIEKYSSTFSADDIERIIREIGEETINQQKQISENEIIAINKFTESIIDRINSTKRQQKTL